MARLETGVDKLVALVAREKKIEIGKAAKQLSVDPAVVREWAEFLEEEGIVSLEFSLSKTYIVEKRLSRVEVEKKEKEYHSKREAFVRRVDTALKQLEDETAGFESIKKQYDAVKQHIGDEIDAVREEMEQLRHYEELKKSIDSDIMKQRVEYQKTLDEVRTRIRSEEQRYQKIAGQIDDEAKKIDEEKAEYSDLKKEEHDLNKRIDALQEIIQSLHGRIKDHSSIIETHEERLTTLRDLADKLREDIVDKRKKEIEPLLKVSDDQSGRILRIQEEIVEKIKAGRDKMREFEQQSREISERFEKFFTKRDRTEQTIRELEKAKVEMKEELNELIRKAKAFEITGKADTNQHVKELGEKFSDFDRRKSAFAKQLDHLKQLIVGRAEEVVEKKQPVKKVQSSTSTRARKDVKKSSKKKAKNARESAKKSPKQTKQKVATSKKATTKKSSRKK